MGLSAPRRDLLLTAYRALLAASCLKLAAYLLPTTAHVVADLVVVEPQALAHAALVHQELTDGL